ncbi:hypothetical protein [Botrimarina sp.]|uniref:hypothetical protein n=1 Tax=Botrimarina sp. TaxID=2795802 RepID=UPI0032F03E57
MSNRALFYLLLAASLLFVSAWTGAQAAGPAPDADAQAEEALDLFDAIDDDLVDVKFVARNDRQGRLIVENRSDQELRLRMPEAFVGVPVLAQIGGGGFGGGGGGFGGGGGGQAVGGGGGLGGGGLGGGGFGGGGGAFSVAPEEAAKIDVPLLCLDHGKRIPSSSKPYDIVPADEYLSGKPEVIELLAAFGRGDLQRGAAQAAVWHANSEVSWAELATKLDGTVRSTVRNPYFSRTEMQMAVAYYHEAMRRATERAESEADDAGEAESMADEGAPRESAAYAEPVGG